MKSLGGVVDMVHKKKRFHFSEENFLRQISKIKNIYYDKNKKKDKIFVE